MPDGMKVTLSAIKGFTVTPTGQTLLPTPFVFQIPPLEEFKVVHAFNAGTYDTVQQGQYSRWGSHQLATWSFDTLVMYLNVYRHRVYPRWVPFPNKTLTAHVGTPMWYREQLADLLAAGCPFNFSASMAGDEGAVRVSKATLVGFSEAYKAGETDCIYFDGVNFLEWRAPTITQMKLGKGPSDALPTTVRVFKDGTCWTQKHIHIPVQKKPAKGKKAVIKPATLNDLAKHFYGNPADWHVIAAANGLKNGHGSMALNKYAKLKKGGILKIPKLPKPPKPKTTGTGGAAVKAKK